MGFIVEEEEYERLFPIVTTIIIVLNIVIFILEIFYIDILINYAFTPVEFIHGERLETLITHMFLHGGFLHIFWNMYFAYVFCDDLESVYGHYFFLLFYILSGIGAGVIHALLTILLDSVFHTGISTIPSIGASGALFGVLASYAVFFPKRKLRIGYVYGYYEVTAWNFVMFYAIMETIMIVFGAFDYVAHTAHVGGFITGFIIAYIYKRIGKVRIEKKYIVEHD